MNIEERYEETPQETDGIQLEGLMPQNKRRSF